MATVWMAYFCESSDAEAENGHNSHLDWFIFNAHRGKNHTKKFKPFSTYFFFTLLQMSKYMSIIQDTLHLKNGQQCAECERYTSQKIGIKLDIHETEYLYQGQTLASMITSSISKDFVMKNLSFVIHHRWKFACPSQGTNCTDKHSHSHSHPWTI